MKKSFILITLLLLFLSSCNVKSAKLKDFNDYKWINDINENNIVKMEINERQDYACFHYITYDKTDIINNIKVLNQDLEKGKRYNSHYGSYEIIKEVIFYTENDSYSILIEDSRIIFENYVLLFSELPSISNPEEEYMDFRVDQMLFYNQDYSKRMGELKNLSNKKFIIVEQEKLDDANCYSMSNGFKLYDNGIIKAYNVSYKPSDGNLDIEFYS